VLATLPWVILTPVSASDLGAESTLDGVRLHWSSRELLIDRFWVERRLAGGLEWTRLQDPVAAVRGGSLLRAYEYFDRSAPPGGPLEYRLVGQLADHREEILGTLTVQHDALAALGVRLFPVRPQPFRAGSSFEFALPASRDVDLEVFDSAGRRVAVLAQGAWPAGRHAVAWSGLDFANRRVPAGVYFVRLVSAAYRETRRVVLVR